MSLIAAVHEALDTYLDVVTSAGLDVVRLEQRPDEAAVRDALKTAGYEDRDDLVGWFTWHAYNCEVNLFWEDSHPLELTQAIHLQTASRELMSGIDEPDNYVDSFFPGPAHWLPLLKCDEQQFLSVEAAPGRSDGRLFHVFDGGQPEHVFDGLVEAIEAAIYCVDSGLWWVEDDRIQCDRTTQPSEADRGFPPWAYYDAPPTWRLEVPLMHPDRVVLLGQDAGGGELLLHPLQLSFLDEELLAMGTVSWSEIERRRVTFDVLPDDQVAGLESGEFTAARVEAESITARVRSVHRSMPDRIQLLSADCSQRLLAAGFEAHPEAAFANRSVFPPHAPVRPLIEPPLTCDELEHNLRTAPSDW